MYRKFDQFCNVARIEWTDNICIFGVLDANVGHDFAVRISEAPRGTTTRKESAISGVATQPCPGHALDKLEVVVERAVLHVEPVVDGGGWGRGRREGDGW